MNNLKISLYIKYIVVFIVATITILCNYIFVSDGVSFISLYEIYSVNAFSDLLLAIDLNYILFIPIFLLVVHREVSLKKLFLLIPLAALIAISQNIYLSLSTTYLFFIIKKDQIAIREMMKWFGIVVITLLISKTMSYELIAYLPLGYLALEASDKKKSIIFELMAVFFTVILVQKGYVVANIFTDIAFVALIMIYHYRSNVRALLAISSFWLAFNGFETGYIIIPFLLYYFESLEIKNDAIKKYYSIFVLITLLSLIFIVKGNGKYSYVILLITLLKSREHFNSREGYFNV